MRDTLLVLTMGTAFCASIACISNPAPLAPQAEPAKPMAPSQAETAFTRIKSLAGTWDADLGTDGKQMTVVTYRVIANGSAVVETLFAGTDEEMETIFTRDGDRVICTHYCAAGNQPRLAASKITPETMVFEMVDATNLPDRNASHMGALKMEFLSKDHCKNTWTSFDKGKTAETVTFDMKRRNGGKLDRYEAKPAAPKTN